MNPKNTSAQTDPDLQLEIAHILLIDVVGYSKLLVDEQIELLQALNQILLSTECFQASEARAKLTKAPTDDRMALCFTKPKSHRDVRWRLAEGYGTILASSCEWEFTVAR